VAISSDQISAIIPNTKASYPLESSRHAGARPQRSAAVGMSYPLSAAELADALGRDVDALTLRGLPFSSKPRRQLPYLFGCGDVTAEQHRGSKVTEKPCFSSDRIRD